MWVGLGRIDVEFTSCLILGKSLSLFGFVLNGLLLSLNEIINVKMLRELQKLFECMVLSCVCVYVRALARAHMCVDRVTCLLSHVISQTISPYYIGMKDFLI